MFQIPPHPELHSIFETLGYTFGFLAYRQARHCSGDVLDNQQRWNVVAAATLGALVGSRLLELLEQAPQRHIAFSQILLPQGGKTIVGGLLGGWIGVELIKKWLRVQTRTGDLFAIPLCIGIAIGRIGCLLAGLTDDTYGKPTSLPWGVNFGDGVARHPTQAYETVFLGLLALALLWGKRRPHVEGILFRSFMIAYLTWRLLIDFLKPQPLFYGMNFIQWSCLAGLIILISTWPSLPGEGKRVTRRDYA